MAAVRDFEELAIFQKARELSAKIYPVTRRESLSTILVLYSKSELLQVPSWITSLKGLKEEETKNS